MGSAKWPQYRTARWQRLRAQLLANNPLCYWGCGRRATTADHVPPLDVCGFWHWHVVAACAPCNHGRRGRVPVVGPTTSRDWYG